MERKRNALQIKDHVTLLDKNDCVDITNLVYSICEKEERKYIILNFFY